MLCDVSNAYSIDAGPTKFPLFLYSVGGTGAWLENGLKPLDPPTHIALHIAHACLIYARFTSFCPVHISSFTPKRYIVEVTIIITYLIF